MKLQKISYQIGCDIPGCGRLSTYSLTFKGSSEKFHICDACAEEMKNELKKI